MARGRKKKVVEPASPPVSTSVISSPLPQQVSPQVSTPVSAPLTTQPKKKYIKRCVAITLFSS